MDIQARIIQMIKSSDTELPTLSVIVDNILEAASNENTTNDELADIITYDPAISNKLLQLANSVYYGQRSKVDTIKRAITVIGFDEIIGITLGMNVLNSFAEKNNGLSLDMKALWIHSIGVATAAKEIAKRANRIVDPCIFVTFLRPRNYICKTKHVDDRIDGGRKKKGVDNEQQQCRLVTGAMARQAHHICQ